jgi:very-short-patch-repair endonuclease
MVAQLSSVARGQLGLFTRSDAESVDVSAAHLRRLVSLGVIERVTPRVFRLTGSSRSWHQDVLAACLDGGPECLASHRTAAALHGFDGFRADVVEVLVPMRVRHRRKNVIVHHTRVLTALDRSNVGLIPVTSKARTLIDLGAVLPPDRVEEALDGAERDRLVRRGQVEARYLALRAPGRNGVGAMTQVLDGRLAVERVPRSVLERKMLRLLANAGLPRPVGSYRVRTPDGTRYEIDFAYVEQRIAIEVDGHGSHATRRERAADNVRASALEDVGWILRRFTYEQVMREPAAVAAVVRAALAAPSRKSRRL